MVDPNLQFVDEIKFKLGHQEWELQRLQITLAAANKEIERLKNELASRTTSEPESE